MTRFLVTGASGLLGINFALRVADDNRHSVVAAVHADRLAGMSLETIPCDLSRRGQTAALLEQTRPDVVLHTAANANVDACERDPQGAQWMNAGLPGELAAETARRGIYLMHISTDAVFDGQRGDYLETDAPNPINVYARTKLAGEQAVSAAHPDALIARVNFFGWSRSGKRSLAEWFYNNLSAGMPMRGFTDVFFCPLLVTDLADVLLRAAERHLSGVFHAVGPQAMSKYDFGCRIAQAFGMDSGLIAPVSVQDGGLQAARSPKLTLNIDKLAAALGGLPPAPDNGIRRFAEQRAQGFPQRLQL